MQRQGCKIGADQMIPPMGGVSVTVKSILPEDVCVIRGGIITSENKVFFNVYHGFVYHGFVYHR